MTNMPLPTTMIAYQANLDCVTDPSPSSSRTEQEDPSVLLAWAVQSSHAHDCLDSVFPSDKAIIEAMLGFEPPWEELHHRSYFLPELDRLEREDFRAVLSERVGSPMVPLSSPGPMADGNMANISSTIPINISRNPGMIENVYIGAECSHAEILEYTELFKEFRDIFSWSYDEMPGIDPRIVEHEINTYPNAKPVRQRLCAMNPMKSLAIKIEIEKLLKSSFIYLVPLTEWVSNLVSVDKKQGAIRICIDFRDLNRACPKDNFPTPFIDQILDECAGREVFSFMDGFSGYNQIQIKPEDQHKTAFICPWGTFSYQKMPFGPELHFSGQ